MTIVPDTKDWTWVLDATCTECGLDTRAVAGPEVPGMVRVNAAAWRQVLAAGEATRQRPAPGVWSPLEYACHVRDVFRLFDARLGRMITEDDPLFDNWNQDVTAEQGRYGEQEPATVSAELSEAAEVVAASFEAVRGEQWQRPGRRSDGARFTVESFARYFVHDVVHHVHDVTPR